MRARRRCRVPFMAVTACLTLLAAAPDARCAAVTTTIGVSAFVPAMPGACMVGVGHTGQPNWSTATTTILVKCYGPLPYVITFATGLALTVGHSNPDTRTNATPSPTRPPTPPSSALGQPPVYCTPDPAAECSALFTRSTDPDERDERDESGVFRATIAY